MSDFSAAVFALNKDKDKVFPFLTKGDYFIQYNEMWVGKLSSDDMEEDINPQIFALSKEIPLLRIVHAEDHGFWMHVLFEGEIKFQFEVSYEVGAELYGQIAYELYGDIEWYFDEEKRKIVGGKVAEHPDLINANKVFFGGINEESLTVLDIFGFDSETIKIISDILTVENFEKDPHEMVSNLLDSLGLTYFSFVAHNYFSHGDDDRYVLLNPAD